MTHDSKAKDKAPSTDAQQTEDAVPQSNDSVNWNQPESWPKEVGGAKGPEPTRYGDWESNGRCTDF